jgi:hypothetical protein
MPSAGYSDTPLPKKLGIKPDAVVLLLQAPDGFIDNTLGALPDGVTIRQRLQGNADVVVAFIDERAHFEKAIDRLGKVVFPDGGCWIAWPKKASKVPTDMTEDVVREVALPLGLVDNKVCAIDEIWSGLRVVWRKELRNP